jgi:hypothetical protein
MSDLSSVTKRLRYGLARVVTRTEAAAAQSATGSTNPDKYVTIDPSREIKLINTFITIPAYQFMYTNNAYGGMRLMYQWNVSISHPFYFLKSPIVNTDLDGFLAIKWRVGTTVYRYFLYGNQFDGNLPLYSGQKIGKYCVFEWWDSWNDAAPIGLSIPLTFETSLLNTPATPDEQQVLITPELKITFAELWLAALPWSKTSQLVNSNCAFLSN